MKNLFKFALGGIVMLVASIASAADDVTIQLKVGYTNAVCWILCGTRQRIL